jgi:hypothetical protein
VTAEQTLYRILADDTSIAGLVDTRIYQDVIPQPDELPAIVYSRTSTEPVQTIHGANIAAFALIQVQVWAKTRGMAEQVSAAIVAALDAAGEPYTARGALYDEETRAHGVAIDVNLFET